MAWSNFILGKGYNCAAAVSKFRCVKWSAAETVTPITGITDVIAGVSQFAVTAGDITRGKGTNVMMEGVSEVEAAGAIAVGVVCQMESDGRVSAKVGASGKRIVGKCVGSPATNAGDRISMLIMHVDTVA